ncbi:MAG: hypothetical protein ACWA44_07310 [Thiotrichales bacterium]
MTLSALQAKSNNPMKAVTSNFVILIIQTPPSGNEIKERWRYEG